jgi:hypothetical protein
VARRKLKERGGGDGVDICHCESCFPLKIGAEK